MSFTKGYEDANYPPLNVGVSLGEVAAHYMFYIMSLLSITWVASVVPFLLTYDGLEGAILWSAVGWSVFGLWMGWCIIYETWGVRLEIYRMKATYITHHYETE